MRLSKSKVFKKIKDVGLIPTFHHSDLETSKRIIEALVNGGAEIIEYMNRGSNAVNRFSKLADWCDSKYPEIALGIGTIYEPSTAAAYINNGADIVISPVLNHKIMNSCDRRKIPHIPGCFTPSEISEAEEAGAQIIKVFPAKVLTPAFISSMMGPSSESELMPSGGVKIERDNIMSWVKAGVVAVNVGSDLVSSEFVESRKFDKIKQRTEKGLQLIEEARSEI